jgi:hypothetical protein
VQTVNLIEAVIHTQPAFKFESHERVLSYLFDNLTNPKLSGKIEDMFFKYLEQRKGDYFSLVAFIVSKNSSFNPQT